ncbi:MAG: hypothetical protein OEY19_13865 [Gammaproteobacteria bacterium]|nr:hypothetical protein [Gammaproteobacteria bacterium]MDH5630433.1 hypothetical protein [Gammaproteobacteria bacterium]
MNYRNYTFIILILGFLSLSGCQTLQVEPKPDNDIPKITIAKRFLANIGAGKLVLEGFTRAIESGAKQKSGLAELVKRTFTDIDEEFLLDMTAKVYSKHLKIEDIKELADYSENPTIQKFFKITYTNRSNAEKSDDSFMKHFNADELTELLLFSESKGFQSLSKALRAINVDLMIEGKNLGEEKLREYLQKQK